MSMVERLARKWNEGRAPYEGPTGQYEYQSDAVDARWWLNAIADDLMQSAEVVSNMKRPESDNNYGRMATHLRAEAEAGTP